MTDFLGGLDEFFDAVASPATALVRHALIAGLIASVTFGIVGGFVVTRRISYIAAAISHSILGGIGASIYLSRSYDWAWCTPLVGSIVAALVSAIAVGIVSLVAKEREDTIIGAIWSTGMAAGVLFIFFAPGPAVNAESFIFGNILLTSKTDLIVTAILGAIVVGVTALNYHKLVAVCFDEEFVRLRGLSAAGYYLLLLCLVALSVVLLVRLTGMILAIALLVLPAATAVHFCRRLWTIMTLAAVLCMVFTTGGLAFSFPTQTPTGPVVVLFAALTYGASLLIRKR